MISRLEDSGSNGFVRFLALFASCPCRSRGIFTLRRVLFAFFVFRLFRGDWMPWRELFFDLDGGFSGIFQFVFYVQFLWDPMVTCFNFVATFWYSGNVAVAWRV